MTVWGYFVGFAKLSGADPEVDRWGFMPYISRTEQLSLFWFIIFITLYKWIFFLTQLILLLSFNISVDALTCSQEPVAGCTYLCSIPLPVLNLPDESHIIITGVCLLVSSWKFALEAQTLQLSKESNELYKLFIFVQVLVYHLMYYIYYIINAFAS